MDGPVEWMGWAWVWYDTYLLVPEESGGGGNTVKKKIRQQHFFILFSEFQHLKHLQTANTHTHTLTYHIYGSSAAAHLNLLFSLWASAWFFDTQ